MWKALVCSVLLVGMPSEGRAQDSCGPLSRPFLKAAYYDFPVTQRIPVPLVPEAARGGLVVCRDRRFLRIETTTASQEATVPYTALVSQARLTSAAYRNLTDAAVAARIGIAADCRLAVDPLTQVSELKITWSGAGVRQHTFRLSTAAESLPLCSPEVQDLWFVLVGFMRYYGDPLEPPVSVLGVSCTPSLSAGPDPPCR